MAHLKFDLYRVEKVESSRQMSKELTLLPIVDNFSTLHSLSLSFTTFLPQE